MSLTQDQKDWIQNAIEKGHTYLEVKKKLQKARYNYKVIDMMLEEYERVKKDYVIEDKRDEIEEEKFENNVKKFIEDEDTKELSWNEKRQIKSFLKGVNKYQEVMKKSIEMLKKEIELLSENVKDEKNRKKEEEYLKIEIIDRIIDSLEILDIEHPKTGKEVKKKEDLIDLDLNELIELFEENTESVGVIVNGKY